MQPNPNSKVTYTPRTDSPLFKPFKRLEETLGPGIEGELLLPQISEFLKQSRNRIERLERYSFTSWLCRIIPESYWEPKQFERKDNAAFYEKFLIRTFKKYLPTSGDIVRRKMGMYQNTLAGGAEEVRGDRAFLRDELVSRKFEGMHLVGAVGMVALSILVSNSIQGAILGQTINLFFNIYPIMLQRYNRARIYNALDRRLELRQQHKVDNEKEEIAVCMRRARCEGLSVLQGKLWYKNPDGANGLGNISCCNNVKRYAGRIQKVALDENTHLFLKVEDSWIDACTALGQILVDAGVEKKRYSTF